MATNHNLQLKAAQSALSSTESKLKSSKWQLAPRITGNVSLTKSESTESPYENSYSTSVEVKQTLFDATDLGAIAEAKASHNLQLISLNTTKAELSRDLKYAYSNIIFSQKNLVLAKGVVERRQRDLDLVNLRFQSGRENGGALQLSKANLEEAKLNLFSAQNADKSANSQLILLLGLETSDTLKVSGNLPINPPPASISASEFSTFALNAPDRLQVLAQAQKSEAAVQTAKGQLLPSLSLKAKTEKYDDHFMPQKDNWSVGLSLTVPILNGSDYHSLQAARADASVASLNRASKEQSLMIRLEQTYFAYVEAEKKVKVTEFVLSAARTRAEIARKQYETGLIDFDEWDRVETDLISRETAILQIVKDRVSAEADWDLILGKGDIP
jgi:outer membrane protein TolC